LAVTLGVGLLSLAARLDPSYAEREREAELAKAERAAERARVAALVPEAGAVSRDTQRINFGDLAFDAPGGETQATASTGFAPWAPEKVRALDGREVRIEGFMLPTRMEAGRASECLILANQQACCYGQSPRFCEFLVAKMMKEPAPVLQDRPLVFTGRLHVGDVFEGKAWTTFYTLEVTAVGR
jgi:hypothetical protein